MQLWDLNCCKVAIALLRQDRERDEEGDLLNPWNRYSGDLVKEDTFIETLYNSFAGQKNQKFVKHNGRTLNTWRAPEGALVRSCV